MRPSDPLLLRLPFWLVDYGFTFERLLSDDPKISWSRAWTLIPKFELSSNELRFAREILKRKRNLWLFRCHQQSFTGDFAVVDMSCPWFSRRRAYLLELKLGEEIKSGGRGAGGQMVNAHLVREEFQRLEIAGDLTELYCGDGLAMLDRFGAG